MLKTCNKCKIEKPILEFNIRSDNKKPRNDCKNCQNIYLIEYYKNNIDKIKFNNKHNKIKYNKPRSRTEYMKNYYENNKETIKLQNKQYYQQNKEELKKYRQDWTLQKLYNISLEEKNELLEKQNFKCSICSLDISNNSNVDHCHKTNKIRGLLCFNCNLLLGHAKDNKIILYKAIKYLQLNS